jgi:hypothetical protein
MTIPQDKQLKEKRQEIKEEHKTRVLEGEKYLYFNANVYQDWMETTISPQLL